MTLDTRPLVARPGVGAVIRDTEGRVLLHRRVIGNGWAPPSGALEPGEDVLTATTREVLEETGLVVEVDRFVGVYSDPAYQIVDYGDGRQVHFVTTVFLCGPAQRLVKGSDEGTEWGWFRPSALPVDLLPYARIWLRDALAVATFPGAPAVVR
jgi:ADP-ribose pyrophosphatase YjhB (NUDIX family)